MPRVDRRCVVQAERIQRVHDGLAALAPIALGVECTRLVGRQEGEANRVRIDLVDALQLVFDGRVESRTGIHHHLPRVHDVVGRKGLAVAPGDVLAQRHGDDQPSIRAVAGQLHQAVVGRGDGRREDRVRLHLVVEADERIEDQVRDHLIGHAVRPVEAVGLACECDRDALGTLRRGAREQGGANDDAVPGSWRGRSVPWPAA